MLKVPSSFKKAISTSFTSIFPVVKITWNNKDIYVSTNIVHIRNIEYSKLNITSGDTWTETNDPTNDHWGDETLKMYQYEGVSLPLLKSLPKLKESIDLESGTKTYKISSVNIEISNALYNDQRFSDILGESSLYGAEIRIYLAGPRDEGFYNFDEFDSVGVAGCLNRRRAALQIYYGKVNSLSQTQKNVILGVEDKSQEVFSTSLPREKLPSNENVPPAYQGKTIPLVVGWVQKSPCVLRATSGTEPVADASEVSGDYDVVKSAEILIDTKPLDTNTYSTIYKMTNLYNDGLFVFENNEYLGVPKTQTSGLGGFNAKDQFYNGDITNPYITLLPVIETHYTPKNLIADNHIEINQISLITKGALRTEGASGSYENGSTYVLGFGLQLIDKTGWPSNVDEDTCCKVFQHYSWFSSQGGDGFVQFFLEPDPPQFSLSEKYTPSQTSLNYLLARFQILPVDTSTNSDVENNIIQVGWPAHDGGTQSHIVIGGSGFDEDSTFSIDTFTDSQTSLEIFGNRATNTKLSVMLVTTGFGSNFSPQSSLWPESRFYNWGIYRKLVLQNLVEKRFFTNTIGRLGVFPRFPEIISHLVTEELGYEISISEENSSLWDNLYYAFTLTEQVNSKKVFEQLSSVSPFLFRFNYLGQLKFDVIKRSFGSSDYNSAMTDNRIIKAEEVISFSFEKSKIEQVYSKIVLNYHYDYGKEEFERKIELDVSDLDNVLSGYDLNYYGFKDDHSTSTFTIDDERGQFIRGIELSNEDFFQGYEAGIGHQNSPSDAHALAIAEYLLLWHCNQHLILNLELPLKFIFLEVGDVVLLDKEIDDIIPYGIRYNADATFTTINEGDDSEISMAGSLVNGQQVMPYFIITETSKGLDGISVSVMQINSVNAGGWVPSYARIGCTDKIAWNYDPVATLQDETVKKCIYPGDFIVDSKDYGCPIEKIDYEDSSIYSENCYKNNEDLSLIEDNFFPFHNKYQASQVIQDAFEYWRKSGKPEPGTLIAPKLFSTTNCKFPGLNPHKITRVEVLLWTDYEVKGKYIWRRIGKTQLNDFPNNPEINIEFDNFLKYEYYKESEPSSPPGTILVKFVYYFNQNPPPTYSGDNEFTMGYSYISDEGQVLPLSDKEEYVLKNIDVTLQSNGTHTDSVENEVLLTNLNLESNATFSKRVSNARQGIEVIINKYRGDLDLDAQVTAEDRNLMFYECVVLDNCTSLTEAYGSPFEVERNPASSWPFKWLPESKYNLEDLMKIQNIITSVVASIQSEQYFSQYKMTFDLTVHSKSVGDSYTELYREIGFTGLNAPINLNFIWKPNNKVLKGDVNSDGKVDLKDFADLLHCLSFDSCDDVKDISAADMTLDGQITMVDLLVLGDCLVNNNCSEYGEENG